MNMPEYWLEVLVIGVGTFLLYMITAGFVMLKRRMKLNVIIFRGLLLASIAAAMAFVLCTGDEIQNIIPMLQWRKVSEFGYKAIWLSAAHDGLPFVLAGFMLPFAYHSCNRFIRAILWAFSVSLLVGVLRFALGSFDIDELIYAFWGFIVGFSANSLIAGLFPKVRVFKAINYKTSGYIIGVLLLMATFFAGVAVLLLDNGSDFVELKLPVIARKLPVPTIASSANIDEEKKQAATFERIPVDILADIETIAEKMKVSGTPALIGSNERSAEITDGGKRVVIASAGNWSYTNDNTDNAQSEIPDDAKCVEIVEKLAKDVMPADYSIFRSTVEEIYDDSDELVSKEVIVEAAYGGYRVYGSCEIVAEVGAGGTLIAFDKHDADFRTYKNVSIISSAEALDIVKNDGVRSNGKVVSFAHNLYQDATAIEITDVNLAYYLEEVRGYLQPIWLFSAKATLTDGSDKDFEIYVPAMDY